MSTNLVVANETALPDKPGAKSPFRKISLAAGLLYLLTFISIPTLVLYGPVHEQNFITGHASNTAVIIGGLLEITVALAGVATAIVLYPVFKRQNESLALGLVASRVLEACTMFVGVAFLLSVVTLHQTGIGKDGLVTSHALVSLYDRIFLLGQGFFPAINDLLLGVLLYKSGLAPRPLSLIGVAGALPLLAGYIFVITGLMDRFSPVAGLSAVLVALFEFSLGVYLIVKGFKTNSPLFKNA